MLYNVTVAKGKRKAGAGIEEATAVVMGFANLVDTLFLRYTGKSMADLIKESAQRPRELPPGEEPAVNEPAMQLVDAYAILGLKLKPDAPRPPLEVVNKYYRNLAKAFHSDMGNVMNDEAMKLLNRAYNRITKGE